MCTSLESMSMEVRSHCIYNSTQKHHMFEANSNNIGRTFYKNCEYEENEKKFYEKK